jgi:hypothetical protein
MREMKFEHNNFYETDSNKVSTFLLKCITIVTIQPYINVIGRLNSPQIDNCTQLSNTFEIDGRGLSIKN